MAVVAVRALQTQHTKHGDFSPSEFYKVDMVGPSGSVSIVVRGEEIADYHINAEMDVSVKPRYK